MLFASAEVTPIASSGGLGEVALKLPQALIRAGHDVRVVIPWYGLVDEKRWKVRLERRVRMDYEGAVVYARVGRTDALGMPLYLVGHREHTRDMYGGKRDRFGWIDEHRRFHFFCAATAAAFRAADWRPDLIHVNDYHNALIPHFWGEDRPPVVLTIHNARFQGGGWTRERGAWLRAPKRVRDHDDRPLPSIHSPRARFVNFLRRGIRIADLVVPVSPTYAKELAQPRHLDELDDVLPQGRVVGILNGIDTEELDPARDRALVRRYDAATLDRRVFNKRALQRHLGLPVSDDTPLLAMIARIDPQKGIDLVLYLILQLAERGVQVAITGNGGPVMIDLIREMSKAAPQVLAYRPFERETESLYYGGADMILVPSRYEPCGLVQLKAMRYGAVPIVQKVGGLADTVAEHTRNRRRGTGFVFGADEPPHLLKAIDRALAVFRRPAQWRALQRRGMAVDVGWDVPASRYVEAYERAFAIASGRRTS